MRWVHSLCFFGCHREERGVKSFEVLLQEVCMPEGQVSKKLVLDHNLRYGFHTVAECFQDAQDRDDSTRRCHIAPWEPHILQNGRLEASARISLALSHRQDLEVRYRLWLLEYLLLLDTT